MLVLLKTNAEGDATRLGQRLLSVLVVLSLVDVGDVVSFGRVVAWMGRHSYEQNRS